MLKNLVIGVLICLLLFMLYVSFVIDTTAPYFGQQ